MPSPMSKKRKIEYQEAPEDAIPLCPSCKQELDVIWVVEKGIFYITAVVMCPHCRTLLGFNQQNLA